MEFKRTKDFGTFICIQLAARCYFNFLRHLMYKLSGLKFGPNTFIWPGNYMSFPSNITIGKNTIIGSSNKFVSRGKISIGNSVNISGFSFFVTQTHDVQAPNFKSIFKEIIIEDYAWVGVNSIILPGLHIGKAAVVGAGAVVTRNVEPYSIVAGNPAKQIGIRNRNLDYELKRTNRNFYSLTI